MTSCISRCIAMHLLFSHVMYHISLRRIPSLPIKSTKQPVPLSSSTCSSSSSPSSSSTMSFTHLSTNSSALSSIMPKRFQSGLLVSADTVVMTAKNANELNCPNDLVPSYLFHSYFRSSSIRSINVTANFITYLRTALIIPTLCMLSWRWWVPASLTIILVDFGDFLDGVVARFWIDKKKEEKAKKDAAKDKLDSDDDSFGECIYIYLHCLAKTRKVRMVCFIGIISHSPFIDTFMFHELHHLSQRLYPSVGLKRLPRGHPIVGPNHMVALSMRFVTRSTSSLAGSSFSVSFPERG